MLSTSIQPQSSPQANYTLDGSHFYMTQETKYLGVVIQLDLKFTSHIYTKISKTGQQLGIIRRTLYPPKKNKLLEYIGLCRPYINTLPLSGTPILEYLAHDIETVQRDAVRFISGLKGKDSITLKI